MSSSAADDGDGALRPADRRSWQWGPVVVGVVVILVSLVALLRAGGPVGGDSPEGVVIDEPIQLVGAGPIVQRFTASDDGLSSISLRFGTYGGSTRCAVLVSLVDTTAPAEPLARKRLPCRALPDSSLFEAFDLRPVGGSRGRDYELRIGAVPSSKDFVAIWSGASADLPPATLNGDPLQRSIELHTGYGDAPHGYDLLGVAMRRMSEFGAPWEHGILLAGALLTAVGALVVLAVGSPNRTVLALVVFAVAKGILWSAVIPPFEGVDEHAHIAYAQYLGAQGRIPNLGDPLDEDGLGPYSEEVSTAAGTFRQGARPPGDRPDFGDQAADVRSSLEGLDHRSNGSGSASTYAPHFYAVPAIAERLPLRIDVRVSAMRLWSIALGAVTVALVWKLGRRVFPDHPQAAVLLALAVALHPMWSQQTAIVNNDAGVICAGAWTLLLAVDLAAGQRRSPWVPFLAGLAAGLSYVAKPFGVVAVPLLLVAWLVGRLRGQAESSWLGDVGRAALGFILSYGTWFVAAVILDVEGAGLVAYEPGGAPRGIRGFLDALRQHQFLGPRQNWVQQFWGVFSWVDTRFPPWTYTIITGALLLGLALALAWAIRSGMWLGSWTRGGRTRDVARPPGGADRQAVAFVLFCAVIGTLAVLHLIMYLHFQRVGRLDLVQGRYALLVAPAVLALPAAVLQVLLPRRSPVPMMVVVASAMAALNVFALALLVERFYL